MGWDPFRSLGSANKAGVRSPLLQSQLLVRHCERGRVKVGEEPKHYMNYGYTRQKRGTEHARTCPRHMRSLAVTATSSHTVDDEHREMSVYTGSRHRASIASQSPKSEPVMVTWWRQMQQHSRLHREPRQKCFATAHTN